MLQSAINPELGGWPRGGKACRLDHGPNVLGCHRLRGVAVPGASLALFRWNVQNEFPGLGNEHSDPLPADYPDLVSLRRALEHFYAVAGRAL